MSPYADTLARARLDALRALVDALNNAQDPAEIRRCAVAILKAPAPCDIDDDIDDIELDDEDQQSGSETTQECKHTTPVPPSIATPLDQSRDRATSGAQPSAAPSPPSAHSSYSCRASIAGFPENAPLTHPAALLDELETTRRGTPLS